MVLALLLRAMETRPERSRHARPTGVVSGALAGAGPGETDLIHARQLIGAWPMRLPFASARQAWSFSLRLP